MGLLSNLFQLTVLHPALQQASGVFRATRQVATHQMFLHRDVGILSCIIISGPTVEGCGNASKEPQDQRSVSLGTHSTGTGGLDPALTGELRIVLHIHHRRRGRNAGYAWLEEDGRCPYNGRVWREAGSDLHLEQMLVGRSSCMQWSDQLNIFQNLFKHIVDIFHSKRS